MAATDCEYYHGPIDSTVARERLLAQNDGADGNFLIRDSKSGAKYVLGLLYQKNVTQYRILIDNSNKYYIETNSVRAVRQSESLGELVEYYLSRENNNGLCTALLKGVRPDGGESSESEGEDDAYQDQPYDWTHIDYDALAPIRNTQSVHIYSEPDISTLPRESVSMESRITTQYQQQLDKLNTSEVSPEFIRKVKSYVDQQIASDVINLQKDSTKLAADHLHGLKHLITEETTSLQQQLIDLSAKIQLLRALVARPGVELRHQERRSVVEKENKFNILVGMLSATKQELCSLEVEAVDTFDDISGYGNIEPLTRRPPVAAIPKPVIPEAKFMVRSPNRALLGGTSVVSLKVDVNRGLLFIIKESSSQALDSSNKITGDRILQLIKSTNNSRMLEVIIAERRNETFYFDDIQLREHFCQLIQQLKKLHSKQKEIDSLSIFCGTWNMGNEFPPQLGIQPWIKSQGRGKTRVESIATEPHDLYAIGTQEAKISEKDWVNKMKKLLHNQFGVDFHLVAVRTLWQIRVIVFVKPEHRNRISNVKQAVVRTGIANTLGNKGASTISMNFDGTSLCFICCHLAANREKTARRNQNSRDIIKNLSSSLGNPAYADFDVTNQFNHVFWFGDLNYRVDDEIANVLELTDNQDYPAMLQMDQLLNTINEEKAFYGFDEELITFPPTYRYYTYRDSYKKPSDLFDWKKMKKSGPKINAPSWCDRVIWKSLPNSAITNTSYGLVGEVNTSDHKPVFASFTIDVLPQNINKCVSTITEPIDIKLYDIKCQLISDSLSGKPTEYCVLVAGLCLEAVCESQPAKYPPVTELSETAVWDDVLLLRPSFSDASYLETQHIMLAVKSKQDGMVMGDCVLALDQVFKSAAGCPFECDLTHLGGKTGTIRGMISANFKHSTQRQRTSSTTNVVVNDIYARPLGDLSWDSDPTPPPVMDTMPRVRSRPKSIMSRTPQHPLPPVPVYDVPQTLGISGDSLQPSHSSGSGISYYNTPSGPAAYYNVNLSELADKPPKPADKPPKPAAACMNRMFKGYHSEEGEQEFYEDAEVVKSLPLLPVAAPELPVLPKRRHPAAARKASAPQRQSEPSYVNSHFRDGIDPSTKKGTGKPPMPLPGGYRASP